MRWWRLLAIVPVGAAALAFGNACSTDTFVPDGGDGSLADVSTSNPQADFCDAQATFFKGCGYTNSCFQQAMKNCGSTYSYFAPAVTAAYTSCVGLGRLTCATDFGKLFGQPCIQDQLSTWVNDSGALAKLGQDFCTKCLPADPNCTANFAKSGTGIGYVASIFDDAIISDIDNGCAQPPPSDAGTACATTFYICELVEIVQNVPGINCADASID